MTMERRQRPDSNEIMKRFTDGHAQYIDALTRALAALADEELTVVLDAAKTYSRINCGWWEYDVAQLVLGIPPVRPENWAFWREVNTPKAEASR